MEYSFEMLYHDYYHNGNGFIIFASVFTLGSNRPNGWVAPRD